MYVNKFIKTMCYCIPFPLMCGYNSILPGTALFLCYVNHLTFFCGCLILNARRVKDSRHCITCHVTASEHDLHEQGHGLLYTALCHGKNPHHRNDDKRLICRIFPKWFYSRYLLTMTAKCIIALSYAVYLIVSIQALLNIQVGFNYDHTIPADSYLSVYNAMHKRYFPDDGPVVTVMFDGNVPYHLSDVHDDICDVISRIQLHSEDVFTPKTTSWLTDYRHYAEAMNYTITDQTNFIAHLRGDFLTSHPQHYNNIKFNADNSTIIASRFYLYMNDIYDYKAQIAVFTDIAEVASNSSYPVHIYSPKFGSYEHHTSIIKNTILTLTVTIISMLLVSLMFLPHLIPVSCVMITMVSVVIGMLGFLQMWNVHLSVLQIIQTVIAIGLTVHFTVQVSHTFMVTTGRTRNERVSSALQRVSETIIQDGICLILGIILLSFGQSYIFDTFFKSMLIAILLGLWHALVLLPTLLSFVGPRRTWKPKVYIAVSPSCRSMSSNFNPFRTSLRSHCSRLTSSSSKPEHDLIPEEVTTEPFGDLAAPHHSSTSKTTDLHPEKLCGTSNVKYVTSDDEILTSVQEDDEG